MTALIYEIIWIRPLTLVFGTTIYAVSTIIASFILGLAVGSWVSGRYTDRLQNPLRYFAFVQLGIGFYGILLLPIFGALPEVYLGLYHTTFPNQALFTFTQVLMSIAMISIPATLMGATLPLMMRTYSEEFTTVGKDVGKLDASNSFGAVVGTLAAGFLLIPVLGIQHSIIATASINVLMGIIILSTKKYRKPKYLAIIIVIVIPFFLLYPSYDNETLNMGYFFYVETTMEEFNKKLELQKVLFYKESLYSSVEVVSIGSWKELAINGHIECNNHPKPLAGLMNIGSIPYEMFDYNYGNPENAIVIGLGCGATSKWLSERVNTTTVEIDPVVAEANYLFYENIDHRLIIDDARNWLLRNDEKFDLIVTDPVDPYQQAGFLFTKEFYSLVNNNLSENGLVSQWVPAYVMSLDDFYIFYNTFHSVFPYVHIYSIEKDYLRELVFIGSPKPIEIKDNNLYLLSNEDVPHKDTELNTDDRPIIEFSSAQNLYMPKYEQVFNKITELVAEKEKL